MKEFMELLLADATVRRHWMEWENDQFPSFEAMLLALCVALGQQKATYCDQLAQAVR